MSSLAPIQVINSTIDQWLVDPLPTNLTVINGTLMNGTIILGHAYNGSQINGTTVIERVQPSSFGGVPVEGLIYLLMSVLILLCCTLPLSIKWLQVAFGKGLYKYTILIPPTTPGGLTTREFDKQLRRFYRRNSPNEAIPSYSETPPRNPNEDFSPEGLRDFRALIRAKYALDVQICNFTGGNVLNQPILDEWKERSRGGTVELVDIVERWHESKERWSEDEWKYVEEVSAGILELDRQERIRLNLPG